MGSPGRSGRRRVTYAPLARDLQPGDRVLLADGAAELRVASTSDDVVTEVVRGGPCALVPASASRRNGYRLRR
jgi:pyruvate kinase